MSVSSPTRPAQTSPRRAARRLLGSALVDLLAGPHGVDRYLELVRPSLTLSDARAEIVAVRRQTARSVTLTLRPNATFAGFRAGQCVRVGIEIDGVRHSRTYSPASSPRALAAEGLLELTATVREHGLVSRHLRDRARPGDILHLDPAQGEFVLPADADRPAGAPVALISGGSGITPVLSMLRTLLDEGHAAPVTFIHYGRTTADHLYREEVRLLAAAHANLGVAYLATRAGDPRLDGALPDTAPPGLARVLGDPHGVLAVCGPPALIEATRALVAHPGTAIDPAAVLAETFTPPAAPPLPSPACGPAKGTLTFAASGRSAPIGQASLLEQAEAAGLSPKHGCRMGICHSCTCRKRAGVVRDLRTGQLSGSDEEDIQICVSIPAGDVELDI